MSAPRFSLGMQGYMFVLCANASRHFRCDFLDVLVGLHAVNMEGVVQTMGRETDGGVHVCLPATNW